MGRDHYQKACRVFAKNDKVRKKREGK